MNFNLNSIFGENVESRKFSFRISNCAKQWSNDLSLEQKWILFESNVVKESEFFQPNRSVNETDLIFHMEGRFLEYREALKEIISQGCFGRPYEQGRVDFEDSVSFS